MWCWRCLSGFTINCAGEQCGSCGTVLRDGDDVRCQDEDRFYAPNTCPLASPCNRWARLAASALKNLGDDGMLRELATRFESAIRALLVAEETFDNGPIERNMVRRRLDKFAIYSSLEQSWDTCHLQVATCTCRYRARLRYVPLQIPSGLL